MSKVSQAIIDAIPGLKAAQKNKNVTFINFDTDDTNPTITEGFDDWDIQRMKSEKLNQLLTEINMQEQQIHAQLAEIRRRRESTLAIIKRKSELQNGVHN